MRLGIDYCGYCKHGISPSGECGCNGRGEPIGHVECGYCHEYIIGGKCGCDGFGGDPVTHEKPCHWCGGVAIGHICQECGKAQ